jgi:hypothetical protein
MTERELIVSLLRREMNERQDNLARVKMAVRRYGSGAMAYDGKSHKGVMSWAEEERRAEDRVQEVTDAIRWAESR